MFKRNTGPGERARRIQSDWALRALVVAALLAGILVAVLLALQPRQRAEPPVNPQLSPRASHSYWLGADPKELETTIKAANAAYNFYLKRDRTGVNIEGISNEFARISSEADLRQVFKLLVAGSDDDYIGILNGEQYRHRMALLAGASIGIDAEVTVEWVGKPKYKFSRVGPTAKAQGLKQDEEILKVNGMKLPPENPWQIVQSVNQLMQDGLLDSTLDVAVLRDGKETTVPLKRGAISYAPAFEISEALHPLSNQPMADVRTLTFNHLYSKTLPIDLYQRLKALQDKGTRGLVVDLSKVGDGDNEIAMRIAAMFRQYGQLGRFIQTTPEGGLVMKRYEAMDDHVLVTTQGPYAVGSDGKIAKEPSQPDKIEKKNWPCNVFEGQVVAFTGRQTSGSGEAIAAAFAHSWRHDKTRTSTVAKFFSAGKGTGQSYFPLGKNYWIRLSTSFCLQPDGEVIEGKVGPAPNEPCPEDLEEFWFARYRLFVRMSTMPHSDYPADRP